MSAGFARLVGRVLLEWQHAVGRYGYLTPRLHTAVKNNLSAGCSPQLPGIIALVCPTAAACGGRMVQEHREAITAAPRE